MPMTAKTVVLASALLTLAAAAPAQPQDWPIDRVSATEQTMAGAEQTIAGAEQVVVGRVTAVEPLFFQNEYGDELIISRTTVVVAETLKGPAADTVEVLVEGGSIGELTFTVSDIEPVALGERGIFMLRQHPSGLLVPHDRGRGLLTLDEDDQVRQAPLTLGDVRAAARRVSGQ